MTGEHFAS